MQKERFYRLKSSSRLKKTDDEKGEMEDVIDDAFGEDVEGTESADIDAFSEGAAAGAVAAASR